MIEILDDVYLITNRLGANVFFLDNGDSFDLVDTGLFKETNELILQIEKQGFDIKLLHKIILTHCYCDHI